MSEPATFCRDCNESTSGRCWRHSATTVSGVLTDPDSDSALISQLSASLARAEQERDEANERCEALEDAVRENLPEVAGDADGNLETSEVCRIETVGLLYRELEKERDAALAQVAALREALTDMKEAAELVCADAGITVTWPGSVLVALASTASGAAPEDK